MLREEEAAWVRLLWTAEVEVAMTNSRTVGTTWMLPLEEGGKGHTEAPSPLSNCTPPHVAMATYDAYA